MNPKKINPSRAVIEWYHSEGRALPWRATKDPYRIWISEIMLQQTRVQQGMGYYERFVARFPTVQDLAEAHLDEVLKYWEGLGYYSRARNLYLTAQKVAFELGGQFPNSWKDLMKLKGVGPYTARAIGSLAFGNPVGVVDGNVFRVLSRYLGDFSPINRISTRENYQKILDSWLENQDAASFNQGIMDLGALICTPFQPRCQDCPLSFSCFAYSEGLQDQLPKKEAKPPKKIRFFHFFLIQNGNRRIGIRQRPTQGLWGGLWEIPNLEIQGRENWEEKKWDGFQEMGCLIHVFTHFSMHIRVYLGRSWPEELGSEEKVQFIPEEEIPIFAFSRAVMKIFQAHLLEKM